MTRLSHHHAVPLHLTSDQEVNLFAMGEEMQKAGLSSVFIAAAIRTALQYEGVADLMFLWHNEEDSFERDEIIADIQELIDECHPAAQEGHQSIKLNDLDAVRGNIRSFKDALLKIVNERGGITALARKTHIPQPSLSRFFNSAAMPRRIMLLKIADALKLDTVQINMSLG